MNNLKEFLTFFWNKHGLLAPTDHVVKVSDLGLFFWKRGGKEWTKYCLFENQDIPTLKIPTFAMIRNEAKKCKNDDSQAQDFMDALACLGEEQIKALILKVAKQ